jgi:elongation factor 1-alpha
MSSNSLEPSTSLADQPAPVVAPDPVEPLSLQEVKDFEVPLKHVPRVIIRKGREQPTDQPKSKKIIELVPDDSFSLPPEVYDLNAPAITEVGIVVAGNVDAGKSSLIGVLFSNELDDGNGKARAKVAKHNHEIVSGKTSDISTRVVKMDNGKAITLIDLCGHEKYLGTTTFGITGHYPDYAIVVVAANRGIQKMTKEHLGILFCMQMPIVIVITRVDMLQEDNEKIYDETLLSIKRMCETYKKIPEYINKKRSDFYLSPQEIALKEQDACIAMEKISQDMYKTCVKIPIITISNKTGYYIPVVKKLLSHLKPRKLWDASEMDGTIFYIDTAFKVDGIGIVLSGIVKGKTISVGDTLYLGPNGKDFVNVKVKSIHNNNREHVPALHDHQRGCIAVASIDKKVDLTKKSIEKGMIVLGPHKYTSNICFRFKAKIKILHHSAAINKNYSPVIHIGPVRQTARIVDIIEIIPKTKMNDTPLSVDATVNTVSKDESIPSKDSSVEVKQSPGIQTGDTAVVLFKFKYKTEFIEPGTTFFFREGTTRGVGEITEIIPIADEQKAEDTRPDQAKTRRFRRNRVIKDTKQAPPKLQK